VSLQQNKTTKRGQTSGPRTDTAQPNSCHLIGPAHTRESLSSGVAAAQPASARPEKVKPRRNGGPDRLAQSSVAVVVVFQLSSWCLRLSAPGNSVAIIHSSAPLLPVPEEFIFQFGLRKSGDPRKVEASPSRVSIPFEKASPGERKGGRSMATCSRPLFVSDSASSASPSRASLRRLHTVMTPRFCLFHPPFLPSLKLCC
jgi:hypothetical protein